MGTLMAINKYQTLLNKKIFPSAHRISISCQ